MAQMTLACIFLLASAMTVSATPCTYISGGASSFVVLGGVLVNGGTGGKYSYFSSSSGNGITGLAAGTYCSSVSDDPMTKTQEATQIFNVAAGGVGKFTLPLVISAYGFFVNVGPVANQDPKVTSVGMDYMETYNLFKNAGTWGKQKLSKTSYLKGAPAFLNSPVFPVARTSGSGTTFIIKKFWTVAAQVAGQSTAVSDLLESGALTSDQFPSTWKVGSYQSGGSGLCNLVATAKNIGYVGYSQRSICSLLGNTATQSKPYEIAVKGPSGLYIQSSASSSVASQAIPSNFPAAKDKWYDLQTVFVKGKTTPPIVSFEFFFVLQSYVTANVAGGKPFYVAFLNYMNDHSIVLAGKYNYDPTGGSGPGSLYAQNKAAIAAVKFT